MLTLLSVGLGGFIGSALRYLLSRWLVEFTGVVAFPVGTLAVNVGGCLMIGLLAGVLDSRHVLEGEVRDFLFVGLLGGFTTFSAFGYETLVFVRDGDLLQAAGYVALHVVLALGAVGVGYFASQAA